MITSKPAPKVSKTEPQQIESLKRELAATQKAKAENDERFIGERDHARAQAIALEEVIQRLGHELGKARSLHIQQVGELEKADSETIRKLSDEAAAAKAAAEQACLQRDMTLSDLTRAQKDVDYKSELLFTAQTAVEQMKTDFHLVQIGHRTEVGLLKEQSAQWKADYEGACKLVADMHAAAVGEIRGPNVGPVEDVAALRAEMLRYKDVATKGLPDAMWESVEPSAKVYREFTAALQLVGDERVRQDSKWGIQKHPDGTDSSEEAKRMANAAKMICDYNAKDGTLTWGQILAEEFYEANAETEPALLKTELTQVAAVCVAWIEDIDRRANGRPSGE